MSSLIVSIASLGVGGAERVLSILSTPLADSIDMVKYVLWEGGEPFYPIDKRVDIVSLPKISGKKGRGRQIVAFRRLIKRERPDLVLSFLTPYNIMMLTSTIGMKQKKVVAERTDPRRVLSGGMVSFLLRDWLYRRADGILAQTEYAKSYYDEKFAGKTKVIYNPVKMSAEQVGMALRTPKEHMFVTAGRLEPVKNQTMMIEAFAEFQEAHPQYKLIIYGGGPMRESLQKMIYKKGLQNAVTLADRTNDLWNKMASAEAFLLSSDYEGMSNALIEAMCLGLPVVSTKVAGATDLIQDGENGFLIDVHDKDDLRDRMACIAEDAGLQERMGRSASKVYDILREDKISKQWVDYLKSMIQRV